MLLVLLEFLWNEVKGGISVEEFASIWVHFIENNIPPLNASFQKLLFDSDGCYCQNRNNVISSPLLNALIKHSVLLLLLSFLDSDGDIGHQQRQLSTELLTGPVVSNQARVCLDSCTSFPQFIPMSRRVTPFFSQYHPEDSIA